MGHPVRFCIVDGLLSGARNVATMVHCTGVPQPTVSQHLQLLRAAGILQGKRKGNRVIYTVCSKEAKKIVSALK
jgi:ArsR family transcriptional regulator